MNTEPLTEAQRVDAWQEVVDALLNGETKKQQYVPTRRDVRAYERAGKTAARKAHQRATRAAFRASNVRTAAGPADETAGA